MKIKQSINTRTIVVGVFFTLLFFLLILRTFQIQAIEAPVLQEKAKNIWNSSTILEPKRGTIYDRNGGRLAYNASAYTVVAILSKNFPNHVTDPNFTAKKLAPILNMEQSDIYSLLIKDAYQVEIRPGGWKVDKETADQIADLNIPGVILKDETKRYYPNNSLASYVTGFLNYDNKAIIGIERQYDEILRGKAGNLKVMKDLKGYELPDSDEQFQPAQDGGDIVLTIDKTIQQYVESALDKAEAMYSPKKIVAIAANPKTGEILAMANRPDYNPNQYWNIKDYQDSTINFQFEPGSTFKIITLAAAIEEGFFDPEETFKSGKIKVPGKVINDHNNGMGWGEITFLEGVKRSSNVAFVMLGYERLGKDRFFSYIDDFGFGKLTGIDLANESKGIMQDVENVSPLDVASISFGQGIATTPIQQVMAVSSIANGGNLMIPYLVKEIKDPKTGEDIIKNDPTIVKRVISEETAKETRDILEKIVEFGKGKSGYLEGYKVAGKTGTAQKIGPDGKYFENKYVVSFIGFAPANNPELVVYVVVDEPDLTVPYYGSTIAVPIFREIMLNSLRYLKVPVDSEEEIEKKQDELIILDDYRGMSIVKSKGYLYDLGLKPNIIGDGHTVLQQYPEGETEVVKGKEVYLISVPNEKIMVPDFIGKSLREALELSTILEINIKINGSGIVIEQNIKPNTIYKGQTLEIKLKDPSLINSN